MQRLIVWGGVLGLLVLAITMTSLHLRPQWQEWRADRLYISAQTIEAAAAKEEALLKVLALNPWHVDARWTLLRGYLVSGQRERAFLHLQSLIEMRPEQPEAWIEMATALRSAGLAAEAQQSLDRALLADHANRAARVLRAQIRIERGQWAGADRDIAVLQQQDVQASDWPKLESSLLEARDLGRPLTVDLPKRGRGQFWPGALAHSLSATLQAVNAQNWAQAEEQLALAETAYKGTMFPAWLRGIVQQNHQDFDAAIAAYTEAMRVAPRSHRALSMLLRAWAQRDGALLAAQRLEDMARADPGFELAWVLAAQTYMDLRQPSRAEQVLREALALPASGVIAYKQLAELFQQLDQPDEALDLCNKGLKKFPQNPDLLQIRADLLMRFQSADSLSALTAWQGAAPDSNLARLRLADARIQSADISQPDAQALVLLEAVERDHESEPGLLDLLGVTLWRAQEHKRAVVALQAAAMQLPQNPVVAFHLARALQGDGQILAARKALEPVQSSETPFPERVAALRLARQLAELEPDGEALH